MIHHLIRLILGCLVLVVLPVVSALLWVVFIVSVAICPSRLDTSLRAANGGTLR